jgi:hypothetical protein
LDTVNRSGLLLVHDPMLPSVTTLIVGQPVQGSWWSHPKATMIFNAVEDIDAEVATVKLIRKKNTLVARSLWQDLCNLGHAGEAWQLDGLDPAALMMLDTVEAATEPVVFDQASKKLAAQLDDRLLAYGAGIHTDAGHHVRAYRSWTAWAAERDLECSTGNAAQARGRFEAIAAQWQHAHTSRLFPW